MTMSAKSDPTILVVEDSESFIDALVAGLSREGFDVAVARDGAEALEMFATVGPDLILLDVMLPKLSGIDVCRHIRSQGSRVPIIMVTARSSEIDYVTKPYRLRELVARVRAVMRRTPSRVEEALSGDVLEVGDVRLDPERHELFVRDAPVVLTLKEFELLEVLLTNAGRVLPRDTLIDRVWGSHYGGDTKTLDVHVKRLRAKIEDTPSDPRRILTVRGLGYKYESAERQRT